MSIIGGQNTPTTNGLAYIIDFNNNYISGSSTVTPILYLPTASQFTGSVPNLVNGQVQFTGSSVLRSFQTFPGFSATQGNMTLMFSGESKNSNVLFTQDGTVAVVSTTSSIGYGVPAGNLGRNFPNVGFDHVTLRFSSSSVDCFINGIPVSASGIFPTVPSSSTFNDFKIGGNYINAWTGSFSGSLGQLMVYNRVLSDDEIYSNYLIQARRYGLPEIPKPYTVDSSVYVYTLAAGITGSSTISALNTFVSGLKSAGLWDKMIAIYPFIGTSPSASRLNLKDVSLNTTQVNYSGSWSTSLSGSYNNNTSSYGILSNITPSYVHPLINSQSIHLSYLSYDTPVSGGYLMGVEQIPGLPGDIAAPAAAYSVRKVRTAYTGSALRVRRDSDDLSFDVGFDASGNLDTGSLLTRMTASLNTPALPGDYSGLAAAYSLRRVSSSYSGYAIEVRRAADNYSASIGFDGSGNLNTASLASFIRTGSETPISNYSGLAVAYSLRKVVPTYGGSAIEIQSGSVSQSIGFNSFGDLDIAAIKVFAGSGDAFVKTWYDQSGNGYHATQSVAANQPRIVYTGSIVTENGKPIIYFDGSNDFLVAPNTNLSINQRSTFTTFKMNSQKADGRVWAIWNGTGNDYDQTSGYILQQGNSDRNDEFGIFGSTGASYFLSTGVRTTITPQTVISEVLDGTVGSLYQNSTLRTSDSSFTAFGTTPLNNLYLGRGSSNLIGDISIQEFLFYTSSQAANRTYIENNINSYYGIYTPTSVSTENAFVKTWYDQSGNNRHATQSVDASQPQIVNNGVIVTENSKPTIKSDGIDDSLSPTLPDDFFGTKTIYTFVVNRNNSAANSGNIFAKRNSSVDGNFNISVQNGKYFLQANDAASPNPTIETTNTYNTQQLFSAARTSNGLSIFTPEAKNATFPVADVTSTGVATIFNGSNFGPFFGNLQELIIYTSDQSTNRGLIEDNINGYYNIFTQSLASGSGYVTTWYDQSGNNRHASQSVATNQPLILSSGSIITLNNKPALSFDGDNDFLSIASLTNTNSNSVFHVVKLMPHEGTGAEFPFNFNSDRVYYTQSPVNTFQMASNAGNFAIAGMDTLNLALNSMFYSSNGSIHQNGILKGSSLSFTPLVGTFTGFIGNSINNRPDLSSRMITHELLYYTSSQTTNRQPIEQNINTYFNIFTPTGINSNTNSLSLFSSPTVVAGAANASPTGLTTGGPEGLITVSRTGSGNYTLWKNRVPTKTSLPASVPQSQSIYLNAANVSNAVFSGSQNTVAYASVGAGLTDSEVYTYYELVDNLQTNLGRGPRDAGAFISTWDTRLTGTGTSNSSSIQFPVALAGTASIAWGDGTVSFVSSSAQPDVTHSYATPGIYTVVLSGGHEKINFFSRGGADKRKILDISQWGTGSWSNADAAFWNGVNVTGTANDAAVAGTTLRLFFAGNQKEVGISKWNVSNTSNFNAMFSTAVMNQDLGNWNMRSATDLTDMFYITSFNNAGRPTINNWRFNTSSAVSINASQMFAGASSFNQPVGDWNTNSFTNMSSMFGSVFTAPPFNQNIGSWNVERVTNMSNMFRGPFNNGGSPSINNWRPISCSNFSGMFINTPFNQPIGNWPLSASNINMSSMFNGASSFNQNIGTWDVSRVTGTDTLGFYRMFYNATAFNNSGSSSINNWRFTTSSTVTFAGMFGGTDTTNSTKFNQNIGSWNVEKVTSMNSMFLYNTGFNNSGSSDINNWRPISCSNFGYMFGASTAFNQPIGNWPLSASSIDMSGMFSSANSFNQNIGSWNIEKVINMSSMFQSNTAFNNSGSSNINNWRPISCSSFQRMFSSATAFNQPVGNWPLSASTNNFSEMFYSATAFNQDIGSWDVSKATGTSSDTSFYRMFYRASAFNNSGSNSINNWRFNTSSQFNMSMMFWEASSFNQNIGSWNVEKAFNMTNMFATTPFNNGGSPDIQTWAPISCSNFNSMFQSATAFNQPVESWSLPTSRTYTMQNMFAGATSFNQPLGNWNIVSCSDMSGMLNSCGMDITNYSNTLIGWASQPAALIPRNITLGATGRQYNTPGSASRAILTSSPYNWTITGDTFVP